MTRIYNAHDIHVDLKKIWQVLISINNSSRCIQLVPTSSTAIANSRTVTQISCSLRKIALAELPLYCGV